MEFKFRVERFDEAFEWNATVENDTDVFESFKAKIESHFPGIGIVYFIHPSKFI